MQIKRLRRAAPGFFGEKNFFAGDRRRTKLVEFMMEMGEGEEILLQGVVDCWFAEEGGLTVLDFKSDRIRPGGERARGEGYRPQLEAYSHALERVTGREVIHRILWFFETGKAVEL